MQAVISEVTARYPAIESERLPCPAPAPHAGIAYHHAGMLPVLKDIVEELFTRRLIQVLYCTETLQYTELPRRTVCFDSSTGDGTSFGPSPTGNTSRWQAGCRGIDTVGHVFTIADLSYFDPTQFPSMKESEIEPSRASFPHI